MSNNGWQKCVVEEVFFFSFFLLTAIYIFLFLTVAWTVAIVLTMYVIESVLHLIVGKKKYKLIIKDKSITMITNKVIIIYWSELTGVVRRHNDYQFKQKSGRIQLLDIDFIEDKDKEKLHEKITQMAFKKKVFMEI